MSGPSGLRRSLGRGSLGLRLLAGTLVWVLATLAVTGFVLADLFEEHVARQFRAELKLHLDQLTGHLEFGPDGRPRVLQPLSDPRLNTPYSGLYWQIDTPAGLPLLRSRSLWDGALALPAEARVEPGVLHEHHIDGPGGSQLLVLERTILPAEQPDQPLRLQVAADAAAQVEPVRRFVGILALALGLLALGLGVAAVIQVRLGIAPLGRLLGELEAVREGRSRRLEGSFPSEIQPLVDEFNTVLSHDTEVLTRARTQAGNLAHAVKTPLAILANAAAREQGELAKLVGEQVATARRQVDYHLARARAAAAMQVPGLSTPVGPVLQGLARVMERLHAERGVQLELDCPLAEVAFRGETQDLQEMLGNLLDNACKWAASRVRVSVAAAGGRLAVAVDDDGPGLPEAVREAVFARGVRADEATPGSGLGLAIVRDLALLYGGDIHLETSPLGGLGVRLELPAA